MLNFYQTDPNPRGQQSSAEPTLGFGNASLTSHRWTDGQQASEIIAPMVTVTLETIIFGDGSSFSESIAAPSSLFNNPIESFEKYVVSQKRWRHHTHSLSHPIPTFRWRHLHLIRIC